MKVATLLLFVLVSGASGGQDRVEFNGRPLFMNGSNVAWVNFAADLGPGTTNFNKFATFFDSVKANGGNSMRFWMHTNGSTSPAYGSNGMVTGPGVNTIEDLRQLLDLAWERRIGLLLSIWSFDMTGTEYGDARAEQNRVLLTDSAARMAYLNNCLVPMVTALKGHPGILAWEVFNEPEGMSEEFGWNGYLPVPMRDIQTFTNLAAGIIQRIDSTAKVTIGAEQFYSLTDVGTTGKRVPLADRLARMSASEKAAIEDAFAGKYGFRESVETILSRTEVQANYNYYRDDRLIARGGDPDGTLDFYTVHFYEWAGTENSPLHHPATYWGLGKPLMVGEFYALPTLGVGVEDLYRRLYDNGYAGAFTWQWNHASQELATKPLMSDLRATHPADISVEPVSGTILQFTASVPEVVVGVPCTISWNVAQGSSVTFNGVAVAIQGDTVVTPDANTEYTLEATGEISQTMTIGLGPVSDLGDPPGALPASFTLEQNYPNPFNPWTSISFVLPQRSPVRLEIFNVLGSRVASLLDEERPAGEHTVQWDASGMPTGAYYYRIRTGGYTETKQMMLVR